jgi:hypothetical protein
MAEKVPVEIDSRWIRLVRSPAYYVIAAFTGISASFAPLILVWAVDGKFDAIPLWLGLLMGATIALAYGTLFFHLSLSCATMKAIRAAHPVSVRRPHRRD